MQYCHSFVCTTENISVVESGRNFGKRRIVVGFFKWFSTKFKANKKRIRIRTRIRWTLILHEVAIFRAI